MAKRYNCKHCGNYSEKSDTCKDCKQKYPFKTSGKGGNPFNRQKEYEKDLKRRKEHGKTNRK